MVSTLGAGVWFRGLEVQGFGLMPEIPALCATRALSQRRDVGTGSGETALMLRRLRALSLGFRV